VGHGCLPQQGQAWAYLLQMQYLQDNLFYGKTGELKREKQNMNRAREWKHLYTA
jgi:hypothetical protein